MIPVAQLLGGQGTNTMKKTSSRRKLAESLLSRGLSNIGKTLNTPVSKLTNKQRLAGALGITGIVGGLAASRPYLSPYIDEIGNELLGVAGKKRLSGLDTASLLRRNGLTQSQISDVLDYKHTLRTPLSESTVEAINSLRVDVDDYLQKGLHPERIKEKLKEADELLKDFYASEAGSAEKLRKLYEDTLATDIPYLRKGDPYYISYRDPFTFRGLDDLHRYYESPYPQSYSPGNLKPLLQESAARQAKAAKAYQTLMTKFPEGLEKIDDPNRFLGRTAPRGMTAKQYYDSFQQEFDESKKYIDLFRKKNNEIYDLKFNLFRIMEQAREAREPLYR